MKKEDTDDTGNGGLLVTVTTDSWGARINSSAENIGREAKEASRVESPTHYVSGKVECIDAIDSATMALNASEAFYIGNIIKYVWRWKIKNGVEDLKKARWYLNRLIDTVSR